VKAGWKIKPLGELCDILDSKRKPVTKSDRVPGPYPYYGATGIQDFVADFIFDEPLVLVGEDGAKWESGESTAFPVQGKYWVNNHAHVVRPFRDALLDNWLIYFLNHSDLNEYVSGLTVPKLNQGSLREIRIPLAPIEEQHRIVTLLDEAFADIATAKANAEKNLQNARELLDSHIQSVFTDKSQKWSSRLLGDVFDIGSSKRIYEADWTTQGVPFFGGKEIVKLAKFGSVESASFISEDKYQEYASKYEMPKAGDILMTARGTIGVGYIVQPGDKFYYKDGNVISLRAKTPSNPQFVLFAFKTHAILDQLTLLVGTTVSHLPIEKAKMLKICLPDLVEQNFLVDHLQTVERHSKKLESIYRQKLTALDDLKKSLLHQAFSEQL
jgi:type I restriction enzyme S subunit